MSNNIQEQEESLISSEKFAQEQEISLKDLIKIIIGWKAIFILHRNKIILLSLLGGACGFFYAFYSKPVYTAKLNFVVRVNTQDGIGALSSLSSLMGMGSSSSNVNSLDRIVALLQTELIVGKTLLRKTEIGGKQDLLINHIIHLKGIRKSWNKDTTLNKVQFKEGDEYEQLNQQQRKAIKTISSMISGAQGKGIMKSEFDKKTGIISIKVEDNNELLSISLTKNIYDVLVKSYTDESIFSIAAKVAALQDKVDSIQYALNYTQSKNAASIDQGLGLLLMQDRVNQKRLGLKENILTLMYGESLKSLEQLQFVLTTIRPSFSIVDQPYSPITPIRKSKIILAAIGFILSAFFSFGFFIFRNWFLKHISA